MLKFTIRLYRSDTDYELREISAANRFCADYVADEIVRYEGFKGYNFAKYPEEYTIEPDPA